ncbi:MAG: cbb3-type cytochrome c oxidase N-terminal domain-containing protein [Planctomycetota bacterium]
MTDKPPQDATGDPISVEPSSTGHSYDGIVEYDNPTPLWWDLLFVASILFAPLYIVWFHSPFATRTLADTYEVALAENMKKQFGEIGTLAADEATILKYMNDSKWLSVGKATFATNCASCHGKNGEGISGVNLTDEYYKHVTNVTDIAKVILEGANAGAMPAWKNRLHPNEVVLASSYVASLRGQNLSGRQAEGKEIDPWPSEAPLEVSERSGDTQEK